MDFAHQLLSREPGLVVSLEEAREQLEVDEDFDAKLNLWIPAAVGEYERMTRRAMMPQTWSLESQDAVRAIELPRPPLISVDEVQSKDQLQDDWVDVDSEDYSIESTRSPARLTWIGDQPRFVRVVYTCGYQSPDDVPPEFKLSILQLLTFISENRGDVDARMPIALRAMIDGQSTGTRVGYWT